MKNIINALLSVANTCSRAALILIERSGEGVSGDLIVEDLRKEGPMRFPTVEAENVHQGKLVRIRPKNRRGQPMLLDPNQPITWTSSDPAILQLTPRPEPVDGFYECEVRFPGGTGEDTLILSGDGNPGEGIGFVVFETPFVITAANVDPDRSETEVTDLPDSGA